MTKTLRDLMARARVYQFSDEGKLDDFLRDQRLSPEERISFKLEMQASGRWQPQATPGRGPTISAQLATDQDFALGSLATDRAQYHPRPPEPRYRPGMTEPERLLAKLHISAPVTMAELERRMTEAGLDAETRISCKLEAQQKNLLKG
jgi:hypothetical protein